MRTNAAVQQEVGEYLTESERRTQENYIRRQAIRKLQVAALEQAKERAADAEATSDALPLTKHQKTIARMIADGLGQKAGAG